jgi:ferrous iron transport protein B
MTVTYILFLLFPLVLGFYFMLSILEDSGYLPRLAALVDKILGYAGLNGRAVIPIILGFGCVTMATITTRILGSSRERTIATTILQLAIPCSAQLGVIAMLLASAKIEITLIYVLIIFLFLAILGTLLNKFMKGEPSPLIIDLPQIRVPRIKNVIKKTQYRSVDFMKEATPWFLFGALFISILQITGVLEAMISFLYPIVVHWLKLPAEAAIAFVMGLVRRDFGVAGLNNLPLNEYQILVAIVVLTLFVPCVTSLIIMFKERGSKQGIVIWSGSLILAFFVGGIVAQIFL